MAQTNPLSTYRKKRDFRTTPEPRGKKAKTGGDRFVVQKHAARRLHYDLRLELGGVMKSWAVTKEPSLDPKVKRLAVQTEDHPLEYATFHGVIPSGYGAGVMEIWDKGAWRSEDGDPAAALKKGALHFTLKGKRLKGAFVLVRLKKDAKSKKENWLLIKRSDEFAAGESDDDKEAETRPASLRLRHVPPQLALLGDEPPDGPQWIHEIKFDGYRMEALLESGTCRLITRNGLDWTGRYPRIAKAVAKLKAIDAIIDGELVALDAEGRSSFSLLHNGTPSSTLAYFVFDLLRLNGKDLRKRPLIERKEMLDELVKGADAALRYSTHIANAGQRVLEEACAMGLEGIVSKKISAPYVSARTPSWVKTKCAKSDEFVVGGWRPSTTKARPFASLLVGEYEGGRLRYRGKVGSGFGEAALRDIMASLAALSRKDSPFSDVPRAEARDARWVEPRLVAQVNYTEKTNDGILRHPTFQGLRVDKPANEVVSEQEKMEQAETFLGVRFTHPRREMYAGEAILKKDVAEHYARVAPMFLRFSDDRPVSLVRCPDGTGAKCFFQKHQSQGAPAALSTVEIEEKGGGKEQYLRIDGEDSLIAAVQMSAVEFHIWGSRADRVEKPDRIVFDLDPDEGLPFAKVKEAAYAVREALAEIGLETFPLLTGGKGIHVIAPIARLRPWPEVKAFCRSVATLFARSAPTVFLAEASKARRRGKIFVDWMRNQRGATAIAPYSLRARAGAPVAAPVSWKELKSFDDAKAFTIKTIGKRVKRAGFDPWPGYDDLKQSIRKSAFDRMTEA